MEERGIQPKEGPIYRLKKKERVVRGILEVALELWVCVGGCVHAVNAVSNLKNRVRSFCEV
jgi:hypothetical protein